MIYLINTVAQLWWNWMGAMFWQVSLLILLISLLDILLRKWAWPQVRYALWVLVIIKLLIPPSWSAPTSPFTKLQPWAQERIEIQWNKQFSVAQKNAQTENTVEFSAPISPRGVDVDQKNPSEVATAGMIWQAYALFIWILGMLLFLSLLLTRISKLRRWHREQEDKKTIPEWFHKLLVETAKRLNLDRLPAIVFHQEAVTPAVYGVFRPVLLLPAHYVENLSREEAEHVLLHELAHVKRGDLLLNGLCLLLQILYWFNPLIILARKQMKHVREMCCDLTIANILREKTMKYRKTLLNTARELLTESLEPGMGLLGVFEEPFRLVARIKWLEKKTWLHRKYMAVAVCCVLIVSIPCLLPMAGAKIVTIEGKIEGALNNSTHLQGAVKSGLFYKEVTHSDSYFLGLKTDSQVEAQVDTWLKGTIAVRDMGRKKIIVDLAEQKFYVINHGTESYVEASLPLDLSEIIAENSGWRNSRHTYSGIVEGTGKSRTLMDKKCDEYLVTFWQVGLNNTRSNFQEVKVWSTTEVDYDLTALYALQDIFRRLVKRDENIREELKKIKGLQMRNEYAYKRAFWSKKLVEEIVEITALEVAEDIYSTPFGYIKKEKLTDEDLIF